jgi:hypothetical protein
LPHHFTNRTISPYPERQHLLTLEALGSEALGLEASGLEASGAEAAKIDTPKVGRTIVDLLWYTSRHLLG